VEHFSVQPSMVLHACLGFRASALTGARCASTHLA